MSISSQWLWAQIISGMKVNLIVRRMGVSEQNDWCTGLGLMDVVKERKQPEKVMGEKQSPGNLGGRHRSHPSSRNLAKSPPVSCGLETTKWCSRCIANGYREGKPLLVYLLSNDIGVMVGLDFERAVVGPEINGW